MRVDDALKLRWSVSEVIQGILILSFYHGKSALALAWGILPEADLLGGTVKTSTPVAPFGSFAPSVSLSTGPPSDLSASLRGISSLERLGMKGTPSTKFFFPTRKRESPLHDSVPEKWRKTPAGEIPLSSTPVSPTDATTPADHPRPKRRQSFDECGTTDEPFPLFDHAALSSSAPHTNSPFASIKPPGSSMLKESYVLSPSSSTTTSSSTFDPNPFLLAEQSPINIMLDDYARFVCPSSLSLPLSDPNRNTYEFLPMEDFDFCNATCIIDSYLESLVGLLDDYIKEAMDAEMDDDNLFNSTVVSADDTSVKEAVWYFSLRQMNIQKDDFRYSDVKYLLSKQTRRYLKRICVQPEMVSAADWIGLTGMKTEEKCRLGLLACQARFLGEVLWGIRGVSEFLC